MAAHLGGRVKLCVARTAMSNIKIRKPYRPNNNAAPPETKQKQVSPRHIVLGRMLDPNTGMDMYDPTQPDKIAKAYMSLPTQMGRNEGIYVCGGSGTGKSVVIKKLIEYFSIKEGRCVIVIDPSKSQYWSMAYPHGHPSEKIPHPEMEEELKRLGMPTFGLPDVRVYVPAYDEKILTWAVMQRDFHATHRLSIRTAGLTPEAAFLLADKDASGKDYQRYLEEILGVPMAVKTIKHIREGISMLRADKTTQKSAEALTNIIEPSIRMGIVSDDGTDIKEMLHSPRSTPGRVSIISLGTNPTDRRRGALLATVLEQLFIYARDDPTLKPVLVLDEAPQFAPKEMGEHNETRSKIINFHVLTRAWNVVRIFGFQQTKQVPAQLLGENTPYRIHLEKSMVMADGKTRVEGAGQGRIFIEGVGDKAVCAVNMVVKFSPCQTSHTD